jgi:hypothetical protein
LKKKCNFEKTIEKKRKKNKKKKEKLAKKEKRKALWIAVVIHSVLCVGEQ